MEDNNTSGAPTPPAPQSRSPPMTPIDQNRKSPTLQRPSLGGSPLRRNTSSSSGTGLPPRRPQLARGGSARGLPILMGSTGTRDRTSSHHSSHSRSGSAQGSVEGGIPARTHMPVTSDAGLLLASLDKNHHVTEDEAESTLLDVLERRQVSFAVPALPTGRSHHSHHRRNRSAYYDELPVGDLSSLGGTSAASRPSSAPSPREADGQIPPLPRPGILPTRSLSSASGGRSGSQRNLLSRPPAALTSSGRAVTDSWAFDEQGQLLQPFTGEISLSASGDSADKVSPLQASKAARRRRGHQRGLSSRAVQLPAFSNLYDRGISDSSQSSGPSGLTTPGERARFVALTMKAMAAENMEDPSMTQNVIGEGELPDLMHALEAHRENESTGSVHKSRSSGRGSVSKGSHLGSASRGSRSRMSKSTERSKASNGFRSSRPFSGVTSSLFANDNGFMSNVEQMFQMAEHVQELCQIDEVGEEEDEPLATETELTTQDNDFLRNLMGSHPEVPPAISEEDENEQAPVGDDAVVDEQTPLQVDRPFSRMAKPSPRRRGVTDHLWSITSPTPGSRFYRFLSWWADLRRHVKMLAVAFDMPFVKEKLWSFTQNEVTLFIIPALAISAFFFYRLNNPIMAALPTDASVSWWILFILRHYVTLQLAYALEYFCVDVLAMRSLVSVQLIGPLATLYTINAKGWPFILTAWGFLNFLLIQEGHESSHASHEFFNHWLAFTEIEMFTDENPSGGVVQSTSYKEILISMILAGVATSLKRTVLALYLGKRIYIHYKPRLEKVMEQMILLTEVADLGEAIDDFEFEKVDNDFNADKGDPQKAPSRASTRTSTRTSSMLTDKIRTSTMTDVVKKKNAQSSESDSESDDEDNVEDESKGSGWNRFKGDDSSIDDNERMSKDAKKPSLESLDKAESMEEQNANEIGQEARLPAGDVYPIEELPDFYDDEPPIPAVHEPVQGLLREKSTTAHLKSLLDEWEEPVNKADKMADPTIHEILQFRKALSFLDDTHPFGSAFGPAFTRETCIKSAKSLYKRLLALSPGSPVLNFDIIGVLAYNIDGTFDDKKAKSLVRLFRPDKFDEMSLLHFVQSCDYVYKKLRLLRASVGNSTLIDSVLENIFNGLFGFFLALTIMSVLQMNPWTLLVSMSTVLVSFAFALGPSAAKLIEGMIMIAVRRPFDLGDRISIVEYTGAPDNSDDPGYHDTWIVEDCNLFTTTLRLSRTNEVSTVNNGSIANTRIVNHGRSHNALVNINMRVNLAATHEQIDIVKSAMEQYIRDNPRVWTCLINFRIIKVDPANDLIVYSARIQHVKSWQDILPVLQAKGDFENFCHEILIKLGIHYPCAVTTNAVLIKEMPEQNMLPVGDVLPAGDAQFLQGEAIPQMPEIHRDKYD